jgi:nucleoside-triphosphatase
VNKSLKRLFLITGRPGIGKTTVLLNVASELSSRGYRLGGMVTREVKQDGSRVGFEIVDYATNRKGWLAHINQAEGPRVSKYRVNLHDLDQIGVKAIHGALEQADVVIIDEIGPMELFSSAFRQVVGNAADSSKPLLGIIHYSARDSVIDLVKKRDDVELFTVTMENRQHLHNLLVLKTAQLLGTIKKEK